MVPRKTQPADVLTLPSTEFPWRRPSWISTPRHLLAVVGSQSNSKWWGTQWGDTVLSCSALLSCKLNKLMSENFVLTETLNKTRFHDKNGKRNVNVAETNNASINRGLKPRMVQSHSANEEKRWWKKVEIYIYFFWNVWILLVAFWRRWRNNHYGAAPGPASWIENIVCRTKTNPKTSLWREVAVRRCKHWLLQHFKFGLTQTSIGTNAVYLLLCIQIAFLPFSMWSQRGQRQPFLFTQRFPSHLFAIRPLTC